MEVLDVMRPRGAARRGQLGLEAHETEHYFATQLATLQTVLDGWPALPRAIGGGEALVELDPSGLDALLGLPVLAPELAPRTHHADDDAVHCVVGNFGLYAQLDARLLETARVHGGPLRAFLVWVNTD